MQFFAHLVKISNDLVKQPETLHALIVAVKLHVELVVIGDGGEDHAYALVRLMVQVLPTAPLVSARMRAQAMPDKSGSGSDITTCISCYRFRALELLDKFLRFILD